MDDDFGEMMFIFFADWKTLAFVFAVLLVLSVTGVILWGEWL